MLSFYPYCPLLPSLRFSVHVDQYVKSSHTLLRTGYTHKRANISQPQKHAPLTREYVFIMPRYPKCNGITRRLEKLMVRKSGQSTSYN
jgi:hypothetical protein